MRRPLAIGSITVIGLCVLACPGPPAPTGGPDLFRVAVSGSPGALLSAWGDRSASEGPIFIAGGFLGVDHALLTDGTVGRLVEYSPGSFVTRCRTDEVLWWVTGVNDADGLTVFAAGENGRVLKYHNGQPAIREIKRVSTPGRRVYSPVRDLPTVANGLGVAILSTPKGVMSDSKAREENVGGEVLCSIF